MTGEEISKSLCYREGNLYWVIRPKRGPVLVGQVAGSIKPSGYRDVQLNGRMYGAHRLIWILHYGPIPNGLEIDHINRVKSDNRIENLRLVTKSRNGQNRQAKRIYRNGNGWQFQRIVKGQRTCRTFSTQAEAEAYALDFESNLDL